MNGSGCKSCPVKPCETMNYRGSACAAQRAKFGLGDPMTNGDWIRDMTDNELAEFIGQNCLCDRIQGDGCWCDEHAVCEGCLEEWLEQPAEVSEDGMIDNAPTVDAVILPCEIGDMVHRKDGSWNVVGFECDRSGSWKVKLERWKDRFMDYHESTKVSFKSFGKTVFLTSKEAAAALAKKGGVWNG